MDGDSTSVAAAGRQRGLDAAGDSPVASITIDKLRLVVDSMNEGFALLAADFTSVRDEASQPGSGGFSGSNKRWRWTTT